MCGGVKRAGIGSQRGAASVELIGTLPFLGLALLIAIQFALAGASLWAAAISARAGARAVEVGAGAGPAARRALPAVLRGGSSVSDGEGVGVRVRVPALVPGLPRMSVEARTSLSGDGGRG
jgi:hypothetical protein